MTWVRLSANEWRRRPLRTGITAAGVAIAVAALFSLLAFEEGYRNGVRRELDRLGAHVLVVPKGCPYDAASIALHGASWPCYLKARYLDEVRSTPGVKTAAPVLMSAFYDSSGRQTVYAGIDREILRLKPNWRITGSFPRPSAPGMARQLLAGSEMARRLHWQVGQEVRLPHLVETGAVISGILAPTNGADDSFIFLPMSDAQALLNRPNQLTHILVQLTDPNDLNRVVSQLRGCDAGLYMNVIPLAHLFRTIQNVVNSTRLLLGSIALIALLAASVGVSNAVLMSVSERTREIGVLRAIGASRSQIFQLIWLETVQVCISGAVVGVVTAFLGSRGIESWLRTQLPFAPADVLIHCHTSVVAICLGLAVLLGSIAGLLPAWRAAWLLPAEAMRRRSVG